MFLDCIKVIKFRSTSFLRLNIIDKRKQSSILFYLLWTKNEIINEIAIILIWSDFH